MAGKAEIVCYSDASMGDDPRRGFAIYINGNLIDWESKRINIKCASSAEAEINGVYAAGLPVLYFQQWFHCIYDWEVKVHILSDATAILDGINSETDVMNKVRKLWYNVRLHKIKDLKRLAGFKFGKIDTEVNVADIFTKPTDRDQFNRLRRYLVKTLKQKKSSQV